MAALPTNANGVVLLGWTRLGGDLRIPCFFGLYAMQTRRIFASLVVISFSVHARPTSIINFSCAYSAVTVVTFPRAIDGEPFFSGGLTLYPRARS